MIYLVQVRSQRRFGVEFSCSLAVFLLFLVPYYIFFKLQICRVFLVQKKEFTQVNSIPRLSLVENAGAALCNFILDSIPWTFCCSVEIRGGIEV